MGNMIDMIKANLRDGGGWGGEAGDLATGAATTQGEAYAVM